MNKKVFGSILAALLLGFSFAAQAEVIINADTTTDTDQGLEFLHVGNVSSMTEEQAFAGIEFDGDTWQLATAEQFLTLIENAAGVSIPTWDGTNLGGYDLTSGQAIAMMDALDGGDSAELPGFWVNGEAYGASQAYAHTGFDDFHLFQGATYGSSVPALFVRGSAIETVPVPTLSQWGFIFMILIMAGFAGRRFYRQS